MSDDVDRWMEEFEAPPAPKPQRTPRQLIAPGKRIIRPQVAPVIGTGLRVGPGEARQEDTQRLIIDDDNTGLYQIENLRRTDFPYVDEVQNYLERKAAAAIGPDGKPLDDEFYQNVELQQSERGKLAEVAPWTRVNPPSVVGSVMGGQQTVTPGGALATCAFWAGLDEEAIAITCTLFPVLTISATNAALGKGAWRIFADVTVGMRGAKQVIRVDIGMGCQFTLAASLVQIDVGMLAPASGTAVASATLGGLLAFRGVTRSKPITSTKYIDSLGSGANTTVFLPLFAKDVTTYYSNAAPTLAYLDAAGNTLYSLVATQGGTQSTIPGDVVAVKVTDGGGGGDVRLVCALEL